MEGPSFWVHGADSAHGSHGQRDQDGEDPRMARHGAASVVGGAGDGGAQGAGVGAGGQGAHAIKEPDPEKMFINVLGGRKGDAKLEMARGELRELRIATEMTKGPLIFKTKGRSKGACQDSVWYPQPLQDSYRRTLSCIGRSTQRT